MRKLIFVSGIILLVVFLLIALEVSPAGACTTGRNFWAGAYQWDVMDP